MVDLTATAGPTAVGGWLERRMGISRKQALKVIEGLARQIDLHLDKIAQRPEDPNCEHWRGEVIGWMEQVRLMQRHVGARTSAQWDRTIVRWKGRL